MPPSSSPTPANVPAAACSIALPAATDPVKQIWSTAPEPISLVVSSCDSVSVRNRPLGRPGLVHRLLKAVADQQRLRGVLEDHGIAGHQRGHHRIDRRQIGIIPRRDGEHDADRLARDVAPEALLRLRHDRRQRALGQRDHGARAFLEPAELVAAVAHRPAHLPGELGADLGAHRQHRVDRLGEDLPALRDRHALPFGLRLARGRDRGLDLGGGR